MINVTSNLQSTFSNGLEIPPYIYRLFIIIIHSIILEMNESGLVFHQTNILQLLSIL